MLGCSSMTNSMSRSGGMSGKSSEKTSAYSCTTGIPSIFGADLNEST
jgi:hypothetical protein